MAHAVLPLMISSLVFAGTWSVSKYISVQRDFEAYRALHPRSRPMPMSRPIVIKEG